MFVAILGDRQATLPAGWTNETAVALAAGDLVVRVPPGSRVRESGFSLLGDRRIEVAAGDGPEIEIKVYGLFSDVKVTDQAG